MSVFSTMGLAAAGIFVTVMLSGILAGIIAFGLIDGVFRRTVQAEVVHRLLDRPVADFLQQGRSDWVVHFPQGRAIIEALRIMSKGGALLPKLLQMDEERLFALPYRQLCGQIANVIASETTQPVDDPGGAYPPYVPVPGRLTLAMAIADQMAKAGSDWEFPPNENGFIRMRALAFLDTIQIALGTAVLQRARWIAAALVLLIVVAILAPNWQAMNMFADRTSALHDIGAIIALFVAPVIGLLLANAAAIVAGLTFRWIDRIASAR